MARFRDLPLELIVIVAESLSLLDVCRWATVSRHFYGAIMFNDSLAPRARETRDARAGVVRYSQGLRKMLKILNAISTGSPFHVAIVAMADDFSYSSGMLCYTSSCEFVYLLDMHNAGREEIVINSRKLLDAVVEVSRSVSRYSFYPLHYAEGVLCCRYEHTIEGTYVSYVVLIDPLNSRILGSNQIPSKITYWVGITSACVVVVSLEETTSAGQYE